MNMSSSTGVLHESSDNTILTIVKTLDNSKT